MEPGPTTIRPDVALEEFTEHMRERRVGSVIVTTSTGHLIGVLYREDADQKLREALE
jgi:predicted transcriptional regulator